MAKKSQSTFTLHVELPESLYMQAALAFANNLDDYSNTGREFFTVAVSKVAKALEASEDFRARVREHLIDRTQYYVEDADMYDIDLEIDLYLKDLFPVEWAKSIELREEAERKKAADRAAAKELAKASKTSRRVQIFVPKASKGFSAELAALLEKYDGKMAEDLS